MNFSSVRGLSNLGNSCFMNSALQCLVHINQLSRLLVTDKRGLTLKPDEKNSKSVEMAKRYIEFLEEYFRQGAGGAVRPVNLFRSMRGINTMMSPGRQHDAHEYFLGMLGLVENYLKFANKRPEFENIFGGQLVSEVLCLSCNHPSRSTEPMVSLSLVRLFSPGYPPSIQCGECSRLVLQA